MRRRRFARRATVAALTAALLMPAAAAIATWTSSPTPPSATISTATLAAPGGLSAANGTCVPGSSTQVALTWTATASTFADGYKVLRSTADGGPYAPIGTVDGRLTTSYDDGTAAFSTAYFYVVQATKIGWTSPDSVQASVTTPNSACQ